ncbi:nitroreductase family protein [Micrococcaceae bacterium Sec5.1]
MELFNGPIAENEVIEAMATARASRYLKSDPLSDELLRSILFAATRASSPANTQPWDFVVVRDPEQRARIASALAANADWIDTLTSWEEHNRMLKATAQLARSVKDVPALVFICGRPAYPEHAPEWSMTLSACYAASQNLIVAARSLGVGATFTTLHAANPDRDDRAIREILELPPEVQIVTTIPLGWPERSFGKVRRKPLHEVAHLDRYGSGPSSMPDSDASRES